MQRVKEWVKQNSWWAGGIGAVALVLLGVISGGLYDALFGESIEDELNDRNLIAGDELEAVRTEVAIAQDEATTLKGQLSALETKVAQDRAIAQRGPVGDAYSALRPFFKDDPRFEVVKTDLQRGNDALAAGAPEQALSYYQTVTDALRIWCDELEPLEDGQIGSSEALIKCSILSVVPDVEPDVQG